MKPKILYWLAEKDHRKVYLSIKKDNRVEQKIIMHQTISDAGFNIEVDKYNTTDQLHGFIKKYKPDMLMQCAESMQIEFLKQNNIKHGYINHGFWPRTTKNMTKLSEPFWKSFDLYCGASVVFKELFEKYSDIKAPVIINALTQFDTLYDNLQNNTAERNKIILNSGNPNAEKVITLFSHFCKNRVSLNPYNWGYYKTAIDLAEQAKKNNWLLVIKPKTQKVESFIQTSKEKWTKDIAREYLNLKSNNYVKFLSPHDDPYKYFCVDLIICSARSTIEVEAAVARKPFITLRMPDRELDVASNTYENGTLDFGAAYVVKNISDLEKTVYDALHGDNADLFYRQDKFIEHLGIKFDGKAHTRVIDSVLKALGK